MNLAKIYRDPRYKRMRSKLEKRVAYRLDQLDIEWEYEMYTFDYYKRIRQGWCPECGNESVDQRRSYTPDFYLPEFKCFLEVKGKFGQVDRAKMRQVVKDNPDQRFIMVFDRDNLIGRKAVTRTRYTEYARKYGMGALMTAEINRRSIKREQA